MEANNTPEIRFKDFNASWEQRKFSELVSLRRGLTYSPADVRPYGQGVRVLRSSNIAEDEFVLSREDLFVNEDVVKIDLAQDDEILITAANGSPRLVGKRAKIHGLAGKTVHGGFMLCARAEQPNFVVALMGSQWYQQFLSTGVAGGNGSIGNLDKEALENEIAFIPRTEEQRLIGAYFSRLDALITLHQSKCDKLVKLKSSMLNRMFPKPGDSEPEIRFAGFNEPWEQCKLGDVASIARGERFTVADYVESGGIPCIHYGEIYTSYGTIATKAISQVSPSLKNALRYAKQGDVIVAATSENVEDVCKAVVWMGNSPVAYHDDSFALTFSGDPIFLASFFETSEFFAQKSSAAHGVKVMRVSSDSLADVDLPLPSAAEQRLIGGYFAKLDNLITLHRRKIKGLKKIKSAMLDKMFV